jgi:hypothetical protein
MWHDHNKYSTSRTVVGHIGGATVAGVYLVLRDNFARPVALNAISDAATAEPTRNPIQMVRNSITSLQCKYPRPLLMFWVSNYFASAAIAGVAGSCTLRALGTGEKRPLSFEDEEEE